MDAEHTEPERDLGPGDYHPGVKNAANASNDTLSHSHHTLHEVVDWVVDARQRRVIAEVSSKAPFAPFDSCERRHGRGRPRLTGDHKPERAHSIENKKIPTEEALMNDTVTYPHNIDITQVRPFGTNGACLYAFEGGRVPTYVCFQGVGFRCIPFRPVTQVCHCCLRTGRRHDVCPYPKERRCGNCGVLNPDENHDGCLARRLTCGSDEHPTIDLTFPARQRRGLGPERGRDASAGMDQIRLHRDNTPRQANNLTTFL
ncbi:hypothetical protein HPB50_012206 [Hyalomma asiaticum]|uniref:Uncharacterized protein n=1 Tax=Hyalomma asiaticum TaxID=266040 RepID=A0ACB7SMA7_HYAAI|nr:hypothetical protein HPB50_012206 [Hyalomma asiaticum]